MAMTEQTLWMLRFAVLGLMGLFLIALLVSLYLDARTASRRPATPPVDPPTPAPPHAAPPQARQTAVASVASAVSVVAGTEPTTGRRYALVAPLTIGRAEACDIAIPVRFVSSRHARLFPQQGQWFVEDLGSRNGTFVNGALATSATVIRPGHRILVGDTEFEVA